MYRMHNTLVDVDEIAAIIPVSVGQSWVVEVVLRTGQRLEVFRSTYNACKEFIDGCEIEIREMQS